MPLLLIDNTFSYIFLLSVCFDYLKWVNIISPHFTKGN